MWRDREECAKIKRGSVRGEREREREVEIECVQNYRNVFMSMERESREIQRVCLCE